MTQMKEILQIFISVSLLSVLKAEEVTLTRFPATKFLYSNVERTFKEALLECHEQNYKLLSIEDAEKRRSLGNILRHHNDNNYYWTSGTDQHSGLRFMWSTLGKSVDIVGLEGNLKNFLRGGHCIKAVSEDNSVRIVLDNCNTKLLFICEDIVTCRYSDRGAMGRAFQNIPDGNFVEHRREKYFISKDTVKRTWNEALAYCKKLGMQLYSIESEEKNKLMRSVSKSVSYWTSGTDMGDHGNWIWLTTGKEFGSDNKGSDRNVTRKTSWSMWSIGRPSLTYEPPKYDDQHCLAVHKEDFWMDEWCYDERPFICEPSKLC